MPSVKSEGRSGPYARNALLAVPALVVAAVQVAQSWMRWLDPIVDAGRDLYIPEHIVHGLKLYRDVSYFYPPLTPYFLAAIVRFTGSSLAAYTAIGGVIALLTGTAIYAIASLAGSPEAGAAAATLFATCSLVSPFSYNQNYFFPYAHAAILAMLFFVGLIASLTAFLYRRRSPWFLVAALLCAFAASWTKVEYAAFTTVVLLFACVVHRISWRWLGAYGVAAIGSIGFVSWYFGDAPPSRHWLFGNVIPDVLANPSTAYFYSTVAGLDRWRQLLAVSGRGALVLLLAVALMAAGARKHWSLTAAGVALASWLATSATFFGAWSILQLLLIPLAIRRIREPIALILLASICATSRIALNTTPYGYGFVFMVPLYLLIAYALMVHLPREGWYSRRAGWLWCIPFAVIVGQWFVIGMDSFSRDRHPIVTPRGTFRITSAEQAAVIDNLGRTLQRLHVHSLVVVPEGLTLNYLYRIDTPLAYHTFTPAEMSDPRAEAVILRDFMGKKPEWIALATQDFSGMNSRGFGVDYGRHLLAWIGAGYRVTGLSRSGLYSVVLLRRQP